MHKRPVRHEAVIGKHILFLKKVLKLFVCSDRVTLNELYVLTLNLTRVKAICVYSYDFFEPDPSGKSTLLTNVNVFH